MKYLIIILYGIVLMGEVRSQSKEERIRKVESETLAKVRDVLPRYRKMASNLRDYSNDEIRTMSDELQDLSYHINQLIQHGTASQGVRPSPGRLAVIKYWGKQIQPYNEILIQTALRYDYNWPYNQFIARSGHLLNYTMADETLERTARQVLGDKGSSLAQSRKAAKLLVEHRKFVDEDKKLLSQQRKGLSEKGKVQWAQMVSDLGMTEGLPILEKVLRTPLPDDAKTKEDVLNHLKILNQASGVGSVLGQEASSLAPILEQRWQEIKRILPEFKGSFPEQLAALKGEKPKHRKWAINGSGYLDEKVDWESVADIHRADEGSRSGNPSRSERSRRGKPVENTDSIGSKDTWDKWPIVLVVILVLGGVFVWVKAKS